MYEKKSKWSNFSTQNLSQNFKRHVVFHGNTNLNEIFPQCAWVNF